MPWVIECGRSLNSREEKLSNFDGSKRQSWETFFINFDLFSSAYCGCSLLEENLFVGEFMLI